MSMLAEKFDQAVSSLGNRDHQSSEKMHPGLDEQTVAGRCDVLQHDEVEGTCHHPEAGFVTAERKRVHSAWNARRRQIVVATAGGAMIILAALMAGGEGMGAIRAGVWYRGGTELISRVSAAAPPGTADIGPPTGPPGTPGVPVHDGLERPIQPVVPSPKCAATFSKLCRPSSPEDMLGCVQSNEEALRGHCGTGHIACELESLRMCRRSTSPLDFNGCVRHNAAKINAKCEGLMFAGELHGLNRSLTFLKEKVGGRGGTRTQDLASP